MPSGVEIERKFLVDQPPSDLDAYPSAQIDQGYLAITENGLEVRIRNYGGQAFLTVKSGAGEVRLEEEIEIDERRFHSLWPLTEGTRIRKRRYLIPAGDGLRLELDVYGDALTGLLIAEVEFDSAGLAGAGRDRRSPLQEPAAGRRRPAIDAGKPRPGSAPDRMKPRPRADQHLRVSSVSAQSVLECRGLRKRFGELEAVRGVEFRISEGETYGLLGPNGAGKTTTISMAGG
jgi:adenylate cyclase